MTPDQHIFKYWEAWTINENGTYHRYMGLEVLPEGTFALSSVNFMAASEWATTVTISSLPSELDWMTFAGVIAVAFRLLRRPSLNGIFGIPKTDLIAGSNDLLRY